MSSTDSSAPPDASALVVKNRGWIVTFSGMGINLALGVLYSWSVLSKGVPKEWEWSEADKSWPFAIACLIFSIIMVPAGRMQDRLGPRLVATIGGILVGAGLIIASQTTSFIGYMVCFGLLAGAGFGFGYASATPPAVKWFPAARTGLVAGIVVSGFGLSSVYVAPLSNWLIANKGLPSTVLILGIAFLIVVILLAQFLKTPPAGYVPPTTKAKVVGAAKRHEDFLPSEMLKTWQFYVLWFMYACGAGAGLMIISKLAMLASSQIGVALGFVLVAALAIGNGAGRILAGLLSDKIGRKATMFICFLFQAALIYVLSGAKHDSFWAWWPALAALSALIGANYGANLSLFPSVTKDFYGLKHFGMNYGLIFTAWGAGGFILPLLAGWVYDGKILAEWKGRFDFAYWTAIGLLILAAIVTFIVRPPQRKPAEAIATKA